MRRFAFALGFAALAGPAHGQQAPLLGYDFRATHAPKPVAELAAEAERLVLARRYVDAASVVEQLAGESDYALQYDFLSGYIALETGDPAAAEARFRKVILLRPDYLRARLELGRALLAQGKRAEAAEQYRLAAEAPNLPAELAGLVKEGQERTAERATWYLNLDVSVIADSNINNATDLDAVPVNFGGVTLPVELDPALQGQSGLGFAASASAGVKVRGSSIVALSIDGEAYIVDYQDNLADDISFLLAAGPELTFQRGSAAVQLIAFQRDYGGQIANGGFGLRGRYQWLLDNDERLTLHLDARIFDSGYGAAYEGEQASAFLVYEVVFHPDLAGSVTFYGRREWLGFDAFSNTEVGGYGSLNAYLGQHLAGGVSLGATRVLFDDPFLTLSPRERRDWRLSGNIYVATRRPAFLGITPSLSYSVNRIASNVSFYSADRHRVRLGLARRF